MVPADHTPDNSWSVQTMSLFGAINTAVSGLTAQSTAFGNISEDVANSQTVGFKRVDTSFVDYLTTSTATVNEPGAVVAHPDYVNNVQGSITQTDNPLGMAIAGQGFFAVSQPTGTVNGLTTYNPQQFYTRAGDFSMNAGGFLVNGAGQYLNGWLVNSTTKIADQNALVPIQISQQTFNPVSTSSVTLAANLPATPTTGTAVAQYTNAAGTVVPASPLSSQITVYDALGTAHSVTLNWTQVPDPTSTTVPPKVLPNQWAVQIEVPDATGSLADGTGAYTDAGAATVVFGDPNINDPDPTVPPAGTIEQVIGAAPSIPVDGAPVLSQSSVTSASPGFSADTITVVPAIGGPVTSYSISHDDGTGSLTSLSTVTTTFASGGTPGTPGVPLVTVKTAPSTSAVASGPTTTRSVAANGTVTFVTTQDDGLATATSLTTTTTTIPPRAGATSVIPTGTGSGKYDPKVSAQNQNSATLQFHTNFGSGDQLISLNLGTYGGTSGVTQFAGSSYSLLGLTQDGVPPGSFSGVTTQANGNVVVNYNNGQTKTIAQIPLVTFNAPDALQSQNGQSFTATPGSGSPLAVAASTNGAGNLVIGSVEGSNVDIATEFTNLIVSQQAYSSNAKVVTTATQMMQATLQMIA
jgi:flagellar hook protein FlgE